MKRQLSSQFTTAAVLAVGCVALFAQGGSLAQSGDALPYTRGFLLTGYSVVTGVDLLPAGGNGTFSVSDPDAEPGAEVVAAYMLWEAIEPAAAGPIAQVTFHGSAIDVAKATRTTSIPGFGTTCWGGLSGTESLTAYRADVLQSLPKQYDAANKWTGRYVVNGQHPFSILPQPGASISGASLILVIRNQTKPLRKIVMYDGVHAQPEATTTSQTIRGFYRSATPRSAQLTYIGGSGAANVNERLLFNGSVIATNPFAAPAEGAGRSWQNQTFDVSARMPGANSAIFGETVTTRVDHGSTNAGAAPYDCLSFGAIIFSTTVADDDHDGLPDAIELSTTGLRDPPTREYPTGQPLPNLYAIGARTGQKDLLLEVTAMVAPPNTTYGDPVGDPEDPAAPSEAPYNLAQEIDSVTDLDGHDHMPSARVLKRVADAYVAGGVVPHFDVGDVAQYFAQFPCPAAEASECDVTPYLVPTAHARGGERVEERACDDCQFQHFPGTVGWPFGLQVYRDSPVDADGSEVQDLADLNAASKENGHIRRRFDRIRHDYFHYALYAHARGKPKSSLPCIDDAGEPEEFLSPGVCAVDENPQFNVPSTASGVASLPGGNVLVTLGLWDIVNHIGSEFMQASTTLHELGHNGDLWHGGAPAVFGVKVEEGPEAPGTATFVEPNCKPQYQSSMSYLFQAHGLADNAGILHIDYSGVDHGPLSELNLVDNPLVGAKYRPSWFAPFASPFALGQSAVAARRYCSGATFDALGTPPVSMARVVAGSTADVIDWDGVAATAGSVNQDANLDSVVDAELTGYNDWANFRLDQLAATRTARIFTTAEGDLIDFGSGDLIDFGSGDLIDFGSGDLIDFGSGTHIVNLGDGDFFRYGAGDLIDFGSGDLIDFGSGDLIDFGSGTWMLVDDPAAGDLIDFGSGDLIDFASGDLIDFGSGDLIDFGSGDLIDFGSGDLIDFGSGDLIDFGSGDLLDFGSGTGLQELDLEMAFDLEVPRPSALSACVLGVDCAGAPPAPGTATYHRIQLTWDAPTFGTVINYEVFRRRATDAVALPIHTTTSTSFIDPEELPDGVVFIYTVRATFADGPSPFSNEAAKGAVNHAPSAGADSYQTTQNAALTIPAPGVLANDPDVDSPATLRRVISYAQPTAGTVVLSQNGSFTYTPPLGFFGTVTFTYKVDNGLWPADQTVPLNSAFSEATVTITVNQVAYGFVNVQNLPPPSNKKFNSGSAVPMQWQWTNSAGVVLNSANFGPVAETRVCSASGVLPPGFPTGVFTPEQPGNGNSFAYTASSNTWKFNWKLVYTANGVIKDLPAGTYVMKISSAYTGTSHPATVHNCGGQQLQGALVTVVR